MSLFWYLYSQKNYIQHKSFSKIKYCSLSDFIIAVMGKSNRCEIEGVWNLFPTPSLKLGSDWDSRLNPVPHYSYYKNVLSLFSHYNYIKPNRTSFVQKKKETFGFYSINNSDCNWFELLTLRMLVPSVSLRIDRKWDSRLTPVQLL